MIELVVFDMAGTTVNEDNVVYKTLHQSILESGYHCTLEDVLTYGAGKEKYQAIKDVLASVNIFDPNDFIIFERFNKNLDEAYKNLNVSTFDDICWLFTILKEKGIFIALNTGYNSIVANSLLKKLGWQKGIEYDVLITADDVAKGRPHPDMIQKAMKTVGITDSLKVLKAGDSTIDIEEGRNSNCGLTVGVTTGAQNRKQLSTANPDHIVDKLSDILQFI